MELETAQPNPTASAENDIIRLERPLTTRVSTGSYASALFTFTFLSAFLLYLEYELVGLVLLAISLAVIPVLALTDRVRFDGRRLIRLGPVRALYHFVVGTRFWLRLKDIEQVDTQAVRAIRRGGRLLYRYSTTFRGKGVSITVVSGGERYRRFVKAVLVRLPEEIMDSRSAELRAYLEEASSIKTKAGEWNIPSGDVLESSLKKLRRGSRAGGKAAAIPDPEKASYLRRLANELRLTGSLSQSIEAFRRATLAAPGDGWLLFEFSRCLHLFAGVERDDRIYRRSLAMMRLAERRAGSDAQLLARIGESYFQYGDWRRAAQAFKRSIDEFGESFLALRGLAEVALREGKIAHVIHNFAAAGRSAEIPSLRRWTQGEVEYFSRLNEDDEYMELEVSRVNLLDSVDRWRRRAFRLSMIGMPIILSGLLLDDHFIANIGWAVSLVSIGVWLFILLGKRTLEKRIPFEALDGRDQ